MFLNAQFTTIIILISILNITSLYKDTFVAFGICSLLFKVWVPHFKPQPNISHSERILMGPGGNYPPLKL